MAGILISSGRTGGSANPAQTNRTIGIEWVLPAATLAWLPFVPPWQEMWLLAGSIFLAFKSCTWRRFRTLHPATLVRSPWSYFCAWPGLDPEEFCRPLRQGAVIRTGEWVAAVFKTAIGAGAIWGLVPRIPGHPNWLPGAVGFAGYVVLLHFGLFHLLTLAWRAAGRDVRPIMDRPLAAGSLADFWGRRWNRAYRRVSYDLFFRPFAAWWGAGAATLFAFGISGLIHDVVISLPARGGCGWPTAYFLLQGIGLIAERTATARRTFSRRPTLHRIYAALFVIAPLPWLFHAPFLTRVIEPFLRALGA